MSLARLYSRALKGIEAKEVIVEVHVASGLPSFSIVGLPDTEVKESRDRVRSAIQMSGFEFPARRITVNLAPADLPKESSRYDLPIALGILIAAKLIKSKLPIEEFEFAGELALDGTLRRTTGALAIAYNARSSLRAFILPKENAHEASLIKDLKIYPASHLIQVIEHLSNKQSLSLEDGLMDQKLTYFEENKYDFKEVKGQISVKKALEIAASGRHSILMIGNPGCGKSMLARRFTSILPPLEDKEAIETASIYSLKANNFDINLWKRPPFREPHHTSSSASLIGGGIYPKPGEISLAHNGVLFLDELLEFERKVLEVLREPLESKKVCISRANNQITFPADFQLIAAMNPCPCGNLGHQSKVCKCTELQVNRYVSKLSAPLMDRIDLIVKVPQIEVQELETITDGESSLQIRDRIIKSREYQLKRQGKLNYDLTNKEVEEYCSLDNKAKELTNQVVNKYGLSARAYYRLLKTSRTIADLEEEANIKSHHIAQATLYRKVFNER